MNHQRKLFFFFPPQFNISSGLSSFFNFQEKISVYIEKQQKFWFLHKTRFLPAGKKKGEEINGKRLSVLIKPSETTFATKRKKYICRYILCHHSSDYLYRLDQHKEVKTIPLCMSLENHMSALFSWCFSSSLIKTFSLGRSF